MKAPVPAPSSPCLLPSPQPFSIGQPIENLVPYDRTRTSRALGSAFDRDSVDGRATVFDRDFCCANTVAFRATCSGFVCLDCDASYAWMSVRRSPKMSACPATCSGFFYLDCDASYVWMLVRRSPKNVARVTATLSSVEFAMGIKIVITIRSSKSKSNPIIIINVEIFDRLSTAQLYRSADIKR